MKKYFLFMVASVFLAAFLSGCASDADVSEAINGVKNTFSAYFALLKEHKSDPAKAVEEGEKFINENREKLKEYGKKLSGVASEKAVEMVEKTMEEVKEMSSKAGEELKESFGENREAIERLRAQIEEMGVIMTQSQVAAMPGGDVAAKAMEEARQQQKQAILDGLDPATFADFPDSEKEATLAQYANSLQGADEQEKNAFKEEIKKKLGW